MQFLNFEFDSIVPWSRGNIVLAGGYLLDLLLSRESDDIQDIDLFVYGSNVEEKKQTVLELLENLKKADYDFVLGTYGCLVTVFILGSNRIIQIIITNEINPTNIVNKFDFTILHSYWDGRNLFKESYVEEQLESKESKIIYKVPKIYRLVKYMNKGIKFNPTDIFVEELPLVLTKYELTLLLRESSQKKIYKTTKNLTQCDNLETTISENFGYKTIVGKNDLNEIVNNKKILWSYNFSRECKNLTDQVNYNSTDQVNYNSTDQVNYNSTDQVNYNSCSNVTQESDIVVNLYKLFFSGIR